MFDILQEVELKERLENFQSSTDKGYPESVSPLTYYTRKENDEILAYSSFSDMGGFYFVGNTYVMPHSRGQGIYGRLLTSRNKHLSDKPKVTLVNPIEGTDIQILKNQVAKQGGVEVTCYEEVADIMSQDLYKTLCCLPVYIYR